MNALGIVLIILAALILIAIIVCLILGFYVYSVSLKRGFKKGGSAILSKRGNNSKPLSHFGDTIKEWFDENQSVEIETTSFDGLKLYARLVENPSGNNSKFVITCHGYTGHAAEMGYVNSKFFEKGFSVLSPEARGHDNSEGNYIGMGWYERKDICNWIDILNKKYNNPQIVLYGISMGAATVMNTAGENLPENVKCAVEDCGFSSIYEQFHYCFTDLLHVPIFPIFYFFCLAIFLKTGMWIKKDGYATRQLSNSKIPMFFVHGDRDIFVPYRMLEQNYNSHPGPKSILTIEGAPHGASSWDGGDLYWDSIFSFISAYVK